MTFKTERVSEKTGNVCKVQMRTAGSIQEASEKHSLKMYSTYDRTKKQRRKIEKGKKGELITFFRVPNGPLFGSVQWRNHRMV